MKQNGRGFHCWSRYNQINRAEDETTKQSKHKHKLESKLKRESGVIGSVKALKG